MIEKTTSYLPRNLRSWAAKDIFSKEEEFCLITKAQAGDKEAKKLVILHNLRIVIFEVGRYKGYRVLVDDLVQEGVIALCIALEKFDVSRGVRFVTYARFWIKAFLGKVVVENHCLVAIKKSPKQRRLFYKLSSYKDKGLSRDDLAREFGVSREYLDFFENHSKNGGEIFLQDWVTKEGGLTVQDTIPADFRSHEDVISEKLAVAYILKNATELNDLESMILKQRWLCRGDKPTLKDIAKKYGCTRQNVKQSEDRLFMKLRKAYTKGLSKGERNEDVSSRNEEGRPYQR